MYARKINELELTLPTSARTKDGTWVSNYDKLPADVLKAEGWKPTEEVKPTFDETTQMLEVESAVDNGDTITVTYKAVEKPQDIYDYMLTELGV